MPPPLQHRAAFILRLLSSAAPAMGLDFEMTELIHMGHRWFNCTTGATFISGYSCVTAVLSGEPTNVMVTPLDLCIASFSNFPARRLFS